MVENGGSVVLVSSAAALHGIANHEAIAAAKAGIIGLAMSAAATYASTNLRFNVVAPGLIETKLTQALTQNPTVRKASEGMHALGRLGKPEDVAAAIIFLLQARKELDHRASISCRRWLEQGQTKTKSLMASILHTGSA